MSLKVYIGPMFSGKTSKLMEIYNKCIKSNVSVLVINHNYDTRYSDTMLSNHNQEMIPCSWVANLNDMNHSMVTNSNVILINEGQFFGDLYEVVKKWVEIEGKHVVVSGLDGDSNRNKFGQMLDLIPIADKVKKLKSFCVICKYGKKAPFTMRCTDQKEQVLIGSDCYKPVCRNCHIYFNDKQD